MRARVAAFAAASLLACNAILGVDDVTLQRNPDTGEAGTGHGGGIDGASGDDDDSGGGSGVFDDGPHPTIALGFNHGCARMLDNSVRCWGDNGAGQLGDDVPFGPTRQPSLRPINVPDVKDAIAIASGLSHTCAVRTSGKIACWGVNTFGQLGDGTTTRSSTPVEVVGITTAKALAGGNSTTCALLQDQTVMCWGYNGSGNLGDGTKTSQSTPVAVKGLAKAIAIAAAADHSCAIVDGGDVYCWGGNDTGQLGLGSLDPSPAPTKLLAITNIAQIATAQDFSCARTTDGKVYCWGANDQGQLGNGAASADPNPSPVLVPSIIDAEFVWTGYQHACAVRHTGTVVCWGFAGQGQTGTGEVDASAVAATPVEVKNLVAARAVWTGGDRSCAVAADNKAYCWGANTLGQLGNGTTDRAFLPTPIGDFP